ncbi:MAG: phosphoenolpyruvate--protein phosphotransferase [Spirochaetes bacterium]|nr:phosphoenolpyruvate--protein phosphotransferase [Spirochaetota bacterium]
MARCYKGIPASPGIAIAVARVLDSCDTPESSVLLACADTPELEWQRFSEALESSRKDLESVRDTILSELGQLKAEIFEAHISLLKDPELKAEVHRLIFDQGFAAQLAVRDAIAGFIDLLSQVDDEMFTARIDDLRDLSKRLTAHLEGYAGKSDELIGASIIVANDLTPSETVQLDRSLVMGFVTACGSAVSHSSILARSLGIPAIVGAAEAVALIQDGDLLVLDGGTGKLLINPQTDELVAYQNKLAEYKTSQAALAEWAGKPSLSADGQNLELAANIGGISDLMAVEKYGADGIGLFRTEFMYMDRPMLPDESEQYQVYKHVLERMNPKPVVIRTLDIGGDKQLDALPMKAEANPFLGVRALRLCLAREDIFRTQLRALLRASVHGQLRIMFPMVAVLEELRAAKAILAEEKLTLCKAGIPVADTIEIGVMIEIPAAALCADILAAECDFFSIGSNDLTQYTMAADRMNPELAHLNQASHPAVLRLVAMAAAAARRHGIWTGVCGEMAADPVCAALLVGMGVTELSMGAASIPLIRKKLAGISIETAVHQAELAQGLESAQAVRTMMTGVDT